MRAVIVYESMYGNTRRIAEAIDEGLHDVDSIVVPLSAADGAVVGGADLLVVGAPTHTFGMSRPQTRAQAVHNAAQPASLLVIEPGAGGDGIREWLAGIDLDGRPAAAFDTRVRMPGAVGHAATKIGRVLRHHGCQLICSPESFFVTKQDTLRDGELTRAREWGATLAARVTSPNRF